MSFVRLLASFFFVAFFSIPYVSASENLDGTYDRIYYGRSHALGKGTARTWVKVDTMRRPVAYGILLTSRALEGLPKHEMTTIRMPLPIHVPPIKEAEVIWESHGHEPDGVYTIPHFDFHFYMIPYSVRSRITCEGEDLARCEMRPADRYVPQDYVWTPGGVPQMGSHWIDPTSSEWRGERFTHTLIHGFYDGSLNFIEPMITREFMLTGANVSTPVKQSPAVEKSGWYPTSYSLKFNSVRDRYEIGLDNLIYRASDKD